MNEDSPTPKTRVVTTTTTAIEMWSEYDKMWVPQKITSSQSILEFQS